MRKDYRTKKDRTSSLKDSTVRKTRMPGLLTEPHDSLFRQPKYKRRSCEDVHSVTLFTESFRRPVVSPNAWPC